MKKVKMFRHGDLLGVSVTSLPKDLKKKSSGKVNILAEGEITGHHHRMLTSVDVTVFEDTDNLYFKLDSDASLVHEEHFEHDFGWLKQVDVESETDLFTQVFEWIKPHLSRNAKETIDVGDEEHSVIKTIEAEAELAEELIKENHDSIIKFAKWLDISDREVPTKVDCDFRDLALQFLAESPNISNKSVEEEEKDEDTFMQNGGADRW